MSRRSELAEIHIGAQHLRLREPHDDSAYRQMLWTIGRVRSAADLDEAGRQAVLKHLESCGWRPARGSQYKRGTPAALIRWLWTQLHREGKVQDASDRALRRYIAQHAGLTAYGQVDEIAPQHLERRDLNTVIEQLKRWRARKD